MRRAMIKALEFRESTMGNILRDADGGSVASRLTAQGMSATDAAAKAALFAAANNYMVSAIRLHSDSDDSFGASFASDTT